MSQWQWQWQWQWQRTKGWLVLAGMLLANACVVGAAGAHDVPHTLPPAAEYDIRWFQPQGDTRVDDWDIEIWPYDPDVSRSVIQAQPQADLESCWVMSVPTDGPARVRVRAVQAGQYSSWSGYTVVPEPSTGAGLCLGGLFLLGCARRRRRGGASLGGRRGVERGRTLAPFDAPDLKPFRGSTLPSARRPRS